MYTDTIRRTPRTIEEMEQELNEKKERLHRLKSQPMTYRKVDNRKDIKRYRKFA